MTVTSPMVSQDLQLTFADSVLSLGGRRPLQPSLKDGVVVSTVTISYCCSLGCGSCSCICFGLLILHLYLEEGSQPS